MPEKKTKITEELMERLLEQGYLTKAEIRKAGIESPEGLTARWRKIKNLPIYYFKEGQVYNGEIVEENTYFLLQEDINYNAPKAPDKWDTLKKRLLYIKAYLYDRGNADSADYRLIKHIEKLMGELEFEEKGGAKQME